MRGRMLIAGLALLWTLTVIAPLCADPTVEDYEDIQETHYFRTFIFGVCEGFAWAKAPLLSTA